MSVQQRQMKLEDEAYILKAGSIYSNSYSDTMKSERCGTKPNSGLS